MKKVIKIIAICSVMFSLVGCGKSYQDVTNGSTPNNDIYKGYFTQLTEWGSSLSYHYRIVYANDTKVKYLIMQGGQGIGMTPLYNTDGSLQIYGGK